jgi:hypothetical protein
VGTLRFAHPTIDAKIKTPPGIGRRFGKEVQRVSAANLH